MNFDFFGETAEHFPRAPVRRLTEGHIMNRVPYDRESLTGGVRPSDAFPSSYKNHRPFLSEFKGPLLDPITRGLEQKRATGIAWRAEPFHLNQHSSSDEEGQPRGRERERERAEGRERRGGGIVRIPNVCPGNPR